MVARQRRVLTCGSLRFSQRIHTALSQPPQPGPVAAIGSERCRLLCRRCCCSSNSSSSTCGFPAQCNWCLGHRTKRAARHGLRAAPQLTHQAWLPQQCPGHGHERKSLRHRSRHSVQPVDATQQRHPRLAWRLHRPALDRMMPCRGCVITVTTTVVVVWRDGCEDAARGWAQEAFPEWVVPQHHAVKEPQPAPHTTHTAFDTVTSCCSPWSSRFTYAKRRWKCFAAATICRTGAVPRSMSSPVRVANPQLGMRMSAPAATNALAATSACAANTCTPVQDTCTNASIRQAQGRVGRWGRACMPANHVCHAPQATEGRQQSRHPKCSV